MKKKTVFLVGCMLMCVSLANADGNRKRFRTDRFPDRAPAVTKNNPARNVIQRGLNDDKDLGTKMWATTVTDYNRDPGFVYFYSNETHELNKTGIIKSREEDELRRWIMSSATYHNGEYLGYIYYRYDLGYNFVKAFAKVDLEKGTWTPKRDMSALEDNWDFMETMYSNPKTGKLMGMPRNRDGSVTSTFGEVNPETGEYTQEAVLGQYYFAMAYDDYGTLWAVRWNDQNSDGEVDGSRLVTLNPENNYQEDKCINLKMENSNFKMYYQNSMYFDTSTGDLWIIASNTDGRQYLCKVNTETGVMEKAGAVGFSDIATGLYIPGYKADSPQAASRVTSLSSTFDENGIVTLKWNNPTKAWNKEELTELTEVLIYRDGLEDDKLVATLTENVTVGGEMTWTDKDAKAGVHVYYIVPCRVKDEKGIPESWRAFTGRDVPGTVENVTLTKNTNTSLTLKWEKPLLGKNDGWYDKDNVRYNVVRYPDKKEIANNIQQTEITDDELGNIELYYYIITAVTDDGEGVATTSPEVLAGSSYTTPYSTDFSTKAKADQWVTVDANQDGFKYEYHDWWEPYGLVLYTSEGQNNDYAISPALKLKGGTTYKVKFDVYFSYCATDYDPERFQTFRITAGQGTTAEAQTIELKKWDKFQHFKYYETFPFEAFFTPEKDGEYNVAYHYYDSPVYDNVIVTGASVEEVFENDLAAMSIEGTANPSKGAVSDYTVKVKNEGKKAASSYKVQVVRLDGNEKVIIGETTVDETLEPQTEKDITVRVTPDVEGDAEFAGNVVLQNDQNSLNNTSEALGVSIGEEGKIPFNHTVTGVDEDLDTRVPISFLKYCSYSQSVYHTSEIGLTGSPKIHSIAFKYDTNTPVEDFNVTVYLSMTDKDGFDDNKEWQPLSQQTKVFEGKQTILSGTGNMMIFDLDEPFEYDPTKNLMLSVFKTGNSDDQFPAIYQSYNTNWEKPRSLRYENADTTEPVGGIDSECFVIANLPVLYLAVEDKQGTGLSEIVIGDGGINYDNGHINLNGIDAASVTVYDLMGRIMLDKNLTADMTSVDAPLGQGIYVVKAISHDGKIYTTKIRVVK